MTTTTTTPDGVEFLRTPDDRFVDLPDFEYPPRFVDVDGMRMAYLDVGEADAPAALLLHGEPAWSFLYRRMIPPLVAAGYRCIVPDLIGFGRSDKPVDVAAYTYNGHVAWMHRFLDAIDLPSDSRFFGQDWGGLIGLRLVAERPGQFGRVAVGNTTLPVGESIGAGFDAWLAFSQGPSFVDVGALFARAVVARTLTERELDGYRAPFPDRSYMAGAIAFPTLVPIMGSTRAAGRTLPHAVVSGRPRPRPPVVGVHRPHSRCRRAAASDVLTRRPLRAGRPGRGHRRRTRRMVVGGGDRLR